MKLLVLAWAIFAAPVFTSVLPFHHLISRAPPNIPSASEAKLLLANLTVASQGPQTGYSRSQFKHWIIVSGNCNTRDVVLKRDGTNVVTSSTCAATNGSWYSPYDGVTWTSASDLDIDHVIPLSNAWKSGAASWTAAQRQDFANDLVNPQLAAITDRINEAKGEKGPEKWVPPLASFHCTYGRMWVKVKSVYALTITTDENSALIELLNSCQN